MQKAAETSSPTGLLRSCSAACLFLWLALVTAAVPASADELWQLPADERGNISLYQQELERLRPGQEVATRVPGGRIRWRVIDTGSFVNGDASLRAISLDGDETLTMTWGEHALFVTLERPDGVWQVQARRDSRQAPYRGELAEARRLPAHATGRDYVIPERPGQVRPRTGNLLLAGSSIAGSASGRLAAVSGDGLRVTQRFEQVSVPAGERMETALTVTVTNRGSTSRRLPDLDLYFLLEDLDVLNRPASCAPQTVRGQPVMRCRFPDALAAGASRAFTFRVAAGPVGQAGTRLWSSAIIEDLRHDASINVVRDVLSGGSGGESEFNVGLMSQTDTDPRGDVVIDVLTLYTPGAASAYDGGVETRINQLFSVANRIYRDSGVKISLRPVRHELVHYPDERDMEQMLEDLADGGHPALADVDALRDEWGADLVILFRPQSGDAARCGLANLGGYHTAGDLTSFNDRDYAHSIIAVDCPVDSVVAHEVGHNMGLTHSQAEDGEGGTFRWATGHGVHGRFATVMADPAYFGGAQRISRFSSPALDCDGLPCGVPHTEADGADAVRTLNTVRFQVADYFPTRLPPLPSRQVATADGAPTQARIALAASVDEGRSYVQDVIASDRVDITARFYVDDEHIGRPAGFHVVIAMDGHFLQLTDGGARLEDWDGRLESLAPFAAVDALGDRETLVAVEQFRPTADLIGADLQVFVAYRLLDSNELVFTQEPLRLRIRP